MYQTSRKIILYLLMLAQMFILWQSAFAAGVIQLDTVDTAAPSCHQTTVSEQSPTQDLEHTEMQDCDDACCDGFCQCNSCVCTSFALFSSNITKSIFVEILNTSYFPTLSDWQPVLIFKPPRQFRC